MPESKRFQACCLISFLGLHGERALDTQLAADSGFNVAVAISRVLDDMHCGKQSKISMSATMAVLGKKEMRRDG